MNLNTATLTAGITNETRASTHDKLQEFYKCKNTPIYFIENYIQLELPGQTSYMNMYDPQKTFLTSLLDDHHVIALKSRQIGISTIVQAFISYVFTFYDNVVVGVVSRDGDESTDFCRKVMSMLKYLPDWLRPKFAKDSERTFILDNGCKFYSSQVSLQNPAKLFRGKPVTIAVIDEAAHIDKIDIGFSGFGPSLFKSQQAARDNGVPFGTVIISTPNKTVGIGRWFYQRWIKANERGSIYKPHKIHWKQIRAFADDPMWYKTQCQILENDPIQIAQELELQFTASTNSFFPPEIIDRLNNVAIPPIAKLTIENNVLNIWEKPDPNKYYLIGVDAASAAGTDFQTVEILDFVTFQQVAEYRSKMRVDIFSKAVDMINKVYSRNLIVVENNSYGNQVVEYLTKVGSSFNVYQQKLVNRDTDAKTKYRHGLSTNAQTRPLIMDALFTYVKENPSLVRSQELALELIGLERDAGGRVEAGAGMNDDLCLAIAFCGYVRMYDPPLSVAIAASQQAVDDIIEILDANIFETSGSSMDISSMRWSEKMDQKRANFTISKHIKSNFHNLIQGGQIDIMKILGFNTITQDRNNQISPKNKT
jgi:hypothetical protein